MRKYFTAAAAVAVVIAATFVFVTGSKAASIPAAQDAYDSDGCCWPGFSDSDDSVIVGKNGSIKIYGGWRFSGLNIPANATITDAYVEFIQSGYGFQFETELAFESSKDAQPFTGSSSPVDRWEDRTSTTVLWTWERGAPGDVIASPSLAASLQEVVSTHGAVDSVVLVEAPGDNVPDGQTHQWGSAESGQAARLILEFTTSGGTGGGGGGGLPVTPLPTVLPELAYFICASAEHTRFVNSADECRPDERLVQIDLNDLKGDKGDPGEPGAPGISCWDLNGNAVKDGQEDTNQDGEVDVHDCRDFVVATPTAMPTGTATPSPTSTPQPPGPGPSGDRVVRAFEFLQGVYGIGYTGPFAGSATVQLGGVEEHLFIYEAGNAMTPELVDAWEINPAGTAVTLNLRQGIKFRSPKGYEFFDFGELDAYELAEWFNRSNLNTNPDSSYADGGDFAAVFGEAVPTGTHTVVVDLVQPVFFCLPVSQFGCLSAARGPHKVTTVDQFDWNWANSHHIGTGPYVQGACLSGVQCTLHAVDDHWRANPEVQEYVGVQVPDQGVRIAMLATGAVDMAPISYETLPDLVDGDTFRFLETMPGGFVGQSIIFSGNLWEEFHARTGEPLDPWDSQAYDIDRAWLGDPWQESHPGNVRYVDTDNPAGMTDMEQARLVRLALSTAINRDEITGDVLNGYGIELYSEYMGPEYPGWDADRQTGCFNVAGDPVLCDGTAQPVPWELADADLAEADRLLTDAGYPLVNGKRAGFGPLPLETYCAEAGCINFPVAERVVEAWSALGIDTFVEGVDYGGVVSPRMRARFQFNPVFKNGDVHSNVYPLDWPMPTVDTSSTRPGWGVGFESPAGARWLFEILAEHDPAVREQKHLTWVDYSMFWVQYAGVYQVPKGIVAGERIKAWDGRQEHYSNISGNPELIELN